MAVYCIPCPNPQHCRRMTFIRNESPYSLPVRGRTETSAWCGSASTDGRKVRSAPSDQPTVTRGTRRYSDACIAEGRSGPGRERWVVARCHGRPVWCGCVSQRPHGGLNSRPHASSFRITSGVNAHESFSTRFPMLNIEWVAMSRLGIYIYIYIYIYITVRELLRC